MEHIVTFTTKDLFDNKQKIFAQLNLDYNKIIETHKKLKHYKYISSVQELEEGHFIRWMNKYTKTLYNGGFICHFDSNVIKCKNVHHKFFLLNIHDNIVFRKLTPDEIMIFSLLK